MTKKEQAVKSYLKNSYKPKYQLEEEGVWNVKGEDPNCDFGGAHHQPFLGRFEGRFIDVLSHAVSMKRFYAWGGGGEVTKYNPPQTKKVSQSGYILGDIKEEYAQKTAQIQELQKDVGELEKLMQGEKQ